MGVYTNHWPFDNVMYKSAKYLDCPRQVFIFCGFVRNMYMLFAAHKICLTLNRLLYVNCKY